MWTTLIAEILGFLLLLEKKLLSAQFIARQSRYVLFLNVI
jgi:hypothetical protein